MRKIEIIFEGSATSGNRGHYGIPGHQGGSLKKGERSYIPEDPQVAKKTPAQQQQPFGADAEQTGPPKLQPGPFVTLGGKQKRRKELINRSVGFINMSKLPDNYWFYKVIRDDTGRVEYYIVGHGNKIYSILNKNSELLGDKRPSQEIAEAAESAPGGVDLVASIQYQLQMLTDEEAASWCELTGNATMSASALAAQWNDWSVEGLSQLLFVRAPDGGEEGDTDGNE